MNGSKFSPLLAAVCALSIHAQVVCTTQSANVNLARSTGNAELLGDLVIA